MGRKGGKKYRREIRKEQSERDKDALFWKLGKQLSDPLGEYRRFIGNLRNKEINEVDDYIDIPINLVDLTANLITSLITGENCLYESINESDKRIEQMNKEEKDFNLENNIEEERILKKRNRTKSNVQENIDNKEEKEVKFTKLQPNSNSSSNKKNKSYSFNFEEYCQRENEESFHFIRKIIKKTQLSLTTFIVGLFFIYSYKHLEKDKRKYREHKVSKFISGWQTPLKKTNKKKRRKRKNKNKSNSSMSTGSGSFSTERDTLTPSPLSQEVHMIENKNQLINKKIKFLDNNENKIDSYSSKNVSFSESEQSNTNNSNYYNNDNDNINNNSNNKNNKVLSPILKSGFLSSFKPRNQNHVNISNSNPYIVLDQYTSSESINNDVNIKNKENKIISNEENNRKKEKRYNNGSNNEKAEIEKEKEEKDKNNNDDDNERIEVEEEEEEEEEEKDENDSNDDSEESDNELLLYKRRVHKHRRHNSQFSALIKNEKFSKNFSYLSSCYILSDRYGSYVIPTFLASIIVADKLLYDATYTNLNWSEFTEGRYTLEDVNELERRFLSIMNFQLFISQKKFDEFLSYLDFILCLQKIRAWGSIPFSLSYSDIYTLTRKIDSKYFDAYPNNKNNVYENIKIIFKYIIGILVIYLLFVLVYIIYRINNKS
ncbi:hypothetical protein BCR32DRAFT_268187, partial [Anaeromyces robustus]